MLNATYGDIPIVRLGRHAESDDTKVSEDECSRDTPRQAPAPSLALRL